MSECYLFLLYILITEQQSPFTYTTSTVHTLQTRRQLPLCMVHIYVYCLLSAAYSSTLPHCCAVEGRDKLSALCPLALWVDLVTLPLVLFQVAIIAFVASVLPFGKVNNVMLIELALTCLVNVFSLLFTLLAHGAWCSCHVASTFHDPLLWHYSCHSRFSHLTPMQRWITYHHLLTLFSLLYFLAWSSSS